MSASEKLKALDTEARGPQVYAPEPQEWEQAAAVVMDALPQIVAVVEAAEKLWATSVHDQPLRDENESTMAVALAALNEALGETDRSNPA